VEERERSYNRELSTHVTAATESSKPQELDCRVGKRKVVKKIEIPAN